MQKSVYEKPIKTRAEVNLSTFSFLFSEIIQYYLDTYKDKFEENLTQLGTTIGPRLYEFLIAKEKQYKRETKFLDVLKIIHSIIWSSLFGKTADSLKKLSNDTYVIYDNSPIYLKFIPPRETKGDRDYTYSCFIGGIIKGILDHTGFPAEIDTQTPPNDGGKSQYPATAFVITFPPEVLKRENIKA